MSFSSPAIWSNAVDARVQKTREKEREREREREWSHEVVSFNKSPPYNGCRTKKRGRPWCRVRGINLAIQPRSTYPAWPYRPWKWVVGERTRVADPSAIGARMESQAFRRTCLRECQNPVRFVNYSNLDFNYAPRSLALISSWPIKLPSMCASSRSLRQ